MNSVTPEKIGSYAAQVMISPLASGANGEVSVTGVQ